MTELKVDRCWHLYGLGFNDLCKVKEIPNGDCLVGIIFGMAMTQQPSNDCSGVLFVLKVRIEEAWKDSAFVRGTSTSSRHRGVNSQTLDRDNNYKNISLACESILKDVAGLKVQSYDHCVIRSSGSALRDIKRSGARRGGSYNCYILS